MIIRAFITHKKAEKFLDCQDRFGVNSDTKSLAVSDGMGASWQQKIWAQILVEEFIRSNDWEPTFDTIKPLCSLWRKKVKDSIAHLKETKAPQNLIFRNERCLAEGRSAGATFVGIRFDGNKWNGSVLGDSCLIEWDGKEAIFYTSQDGDEFDSYPDYFDSDENKTGKGSPLNINGTLTKDTHLLLVSDPFSDFLFEKKKQGSIVQYINQLLSISNHENFERLVENWRLKGMHNDDTTLVIVKDDVKDTFYLENIDNINVFVEKEKEEEEKEQSIPNFEEKLPVDKTIKSEVEAINDGYLNLIQPSLFINEFLARYRSILEKKCKMLKNLKFKTTREAAKQALEELLEKYTIIIK